MGAIFNFQIRSGKAKDRNSEPRISSAENFLKKMQHIACNVAAAITLYSTNGDFRCKHHA